jgi:hypothetical protein
MKQQVLAMAGVSAAEREVVERVRVHILPMDPIVFETTDRKAVTVGGADLVPGYVESIRADIESRGPTYVPQLVEHDGAAVGMVVGPVLTDNGIELDVDLWAEGVEARYGRDFVSAWWEFSDFGPDGRPRIATIKENSFTPKPQFAICQTPVSELETMVTEIESTNRVAATISAAAYLTPPGSEMMTPEEMAAAILEVPEFGEAIQGMISAAMKAAEPEAEEAPAAEEPMPEEAEEEVAAADEEPTEDAAEESADVAASLARLEQEVAEIKQGQARSEEVAASLAGRITNPAVHAIPESFGGRVLHFRKQGMGRPEAVAAARNFNTSEH